VHSDTKTSADKIPKTSSLLSSPPHSSSLTPATRSPRFSTPTALKQRSVSSQASATQPTARSLLVEDEDESDKSDEEAVKEVETGSVEDAAGPPTVHALSSDSEEVLFKYGTVARILAEAGIDIGALGGPLPASTTPSTLRMYMHCCAKASYLRVDNIMWVSTAFCRPSSRGQNGCHGRGTTRAQ
jgi:hypothetical protein